MESTNPSAETHGDQNYSTLADNTPPCPSPKVDSSQPSAHISPSSVTTEQKNPSTSKTSFIASRCFNWVIGFAIAATIICTVSLLIYLNVIPMPHQQLIEIAGTILGGASAVSSLGLLVSNPLYVPDCSEGYTNPSWLNQHCMRHPYVPKAPTNHPATPNTTQERNAPPSKDDLYRMTPSLADQPELNKTYVYHCDNGTLSTTEDSAPQDPHQATPPPSNDRTTAAYNSNPRPYVRNYYGKYVPFYPEYYNITDPELISRCFNSSHCENGSLDRFLSDSLQDFFNKLPASERQHEDSNHPKFKLHIPRLECSAYDTRFDTENLVSIPFDEDPAAPDFELDPSTDTYKSLREVPYTHRPVNFAVLDMADSLSTERGYCHSAGEWRKTDLSQGGVCAGTFGPRCDRDRKVIQDDNTALGITTEIVSTYFWRPITSQKEIDALNQIIAPLKQACLQRGESFETAYPRLFFDITYEGPDKNIMKIKRSLGFEQQAFRLAHGLHSF